MTPTGNLRLWALSTLMLLLAGSAYAQFDTRFWMPPIWDSGQNAHNQPSELFITTPSPNPVNVHIETADGTTWSFDGEVTASNPLVVPLTTNLGQTTTANTVNTTQGLVVTSNQAIQCVHKISGANNQTLVTLKGRNGRGTEFWAGSQVRNMNATYSPNEFHFISVMALEDNTTITFETPFDMWASGSGNLPNPYTITLNAKESYLIRGNNPVQHVTGARVTSNKEIVTISGSTHTRITGGTAAEGGTDQLVPIGLTNTDFVVIKGDNNDPFDYAIIVATENNTDVFVNGSATPVATLNAGQFYDYTLTGGVGAPHYLRASKRAYCYHVSGAANKDEVGMSAIPQIECTGSRYIEFSRFTVNTNNQIMNITCPPEAEPTLMWNGVHYADVPSAIINPIPGLPGWVAITMPNTALANNNIITSEGFFHAGFLTGTGATGTYGYLSGFNDAFEFLDPVTLLPTTIYTAGTLCTGESIDHCLLVFSCADDHNIIDVQGNDGMVTVTPPTTPFDTCFTYTAPFDYAGGDTITFTVDNRFGFSGNIDVVFNVVNPATPIDAGPMQELCGVFTTTLSAVDPDPLVPGQWTLISGNGTIANPNAATTSVTGLGLGINVFQWSQDYGCQINTDITQVVVYEGTPPDANAGADAQLCSDNNTYTLQANDPGVTATGTWTLTQGSATIANINSPNAFVSGLSIGENILVWSLNNGPCQGNATEDEVSIFVFDANHPQADAGLDQAFCSDNFTLASLIGNAPIFPATGTWSVISGSGTFSNPNNRETQVNGLSIGENVFMWSIDNGPCGTLTDTVTITLYDGDVASANAGNDLALCTPNTSAQLQAVDPNGPGFGTWTIVSGTGTFSNPNLATATVSNLSIGTNVLRWTLDNGPCAATGSFDDITISVFDNNLPDANAGVDQQLCVAEISDAQLNAVAVDHPAAGSWTVTAGNASIADPNDPNTTVSGLSLGVNTFVWTVDNGPCAAPTTASVDVVVYNDDLDPANAGPDASFCTPTSTYTMQATPVTPPAVGEWSLVSGTGTIANVNSPTTNVSGLGIGANVFRWTILNGPCPGEEVFDEVTLFIYDENAPVANAGPNQFLCDNPVSPLVVTLAANSAIFPGEGSWSLVSGNGVIADPSNPNTTVIDLGVGENIFEWTLNNGPCAQGVSSDQVSIFIYDLTQAVADAGENQNLCSDDPNTTLAANAATFPASGQWVLLSGQATIDDPSNPNTTVSGLGVGQNVFEWTLNNGPCANGITSDQVVVTVFEGALSPANAGMDQVICSTTTTVTLNGNPPLAPASGEWTLISGSGAIANPGQFNTAVSDLGLGENVFAWTVNNGPCSGFTTDEVTITVYDALLPTAHAGQDQFLCLPQTATNLEAIAAPFPANGAWQVVSGTGTFADASNPNTLVSDLSVGLNTFRWVVTNGPCAPSTSQDDVSIWVYDNGQTVSAGSDLSLCTPVTSTVLNGTAPIFPATAQWTLVSGSGTLTNPNNPTTTVTGLAIGENVFEYSINNGPCSPEVLSATVTITVYDDNQPDANAGADIELCTPQQSVTMSASAVTFPASGEWSLVSGSAVIENPNDPNTTVSGLTPGTVVLAWNVSNGPCNPPNSSDQVTIRIYDTDAPMANAGADLAFCQPAGTVALSGNAPVSPATGQWTLVSGNGIIANPSNPNTTVSGLGIGNNVFAWTITNGGCGGTSTDQMTIAVFSPNAPAANAGDDQNLCTPDNFTNLNGNAPQIPGTGFWSLVSGTGTILEPENPNSPVEGLAIGENVFEYTISNGPCGSSSDLVSIFVFDGGAPQANAGPNITFCTPENSVNLNAVPAVEPGVGTWTVINGSGTFADANDPNTSVNNLSVGINVFAWTLDYATCGVQEDFVNVVVYDASIPPANAGADQSLCTPVDFTSMNATAVALPAIGTWTLLSGSADISNPNDPNTAIENLSPGQNTFVWTVFNGECLAEEDRTDTVNIFVFNNALADAHAGDDQFLCTPQTSTQLTGSSINGAATAAWSVVSGTGIIAEPNNPNTAVSGLSVGENVFMYTVNNGNCDNGITTDTVSIFVYDENQPPANAGEDQALCTPVSSVTLNGNAAIFPAEGTWVLISGSGTIAEPNNPNTAVTALAPGANTFRWRITNGPCGTFTQDFVTIFIFDGFNAAADAGEDQALCAPNFSTALNANTPGDPAQGTWTLISGQGTIVDASNPTSMVNDLGIGENVFMWTIDNGACENPITTDTVTITVYDPSADAADAGEDQFLCTPFTTTTLNGNAPLFPATGTWELIEGSGIIADLNNPNSEVTGLAVGTNVFRWTIDNGPCAGSGSSDLVTITLYDREQAVANAGNDQQLCTPQEATTLSANAAPFPASGFWTLVEGSGTIVDPTNPNSPFTNIAPGVNVLVWTIENGVCENAITTDAVTISLFNFDATVADAGANQELCLPQTSTQLSANATSGAAIGSWQVISGSASFANPNDPETTVTDLGTGNNVLAWVIDNGPCGESTDTVTISVFDPEAPIADAGDDQFFCTPISTTLLNGNAPATPGTGTWTLLSGMGTINAPNDPNTAISGLTIGENVFCWTIYNGPCDEPTVDCMSVFIYDENHPAAQAGADQELCLPNNTTFLQATPAIFPAFGTWELVSGSGTLLNPNDPNTAVTGLELGANTFVWTLNNAPCENGNNSDEVTIFVFEEGIAPAFAGEDQAFCSPVSSTTLTASSLNSPNTGTWELIDGNGSIDEPFNHETSVSGLTIGENRFVWTVYNGSCELALSSDTVSVFIFDEQQTPALAGPAQELCLPTNGTLLQGNAPVFPAEGQWNLIAGSGDLLDPSDPNSAVMNLGLGINTFEWVIDNGVCGNASSATVDILVFSEDAANANAGDDIEICTPSSSVVLGAAPPDVPTTGTWTIIQGNGSLSNVNDPNAVYSGLTIGEHILQWSIYNGPCATNNSFDFVTIHVFDGNNPPANAGENQALCAPDDTAQLNAQAPIFPATGAWSIISGSGSLSDVNDPNATITGMGIGTTVIRWVVYNGPCNDADESMVTITIYDPDSPTALAGDDQHFCTPFGGTTLEGNAALLPSTGTWTLISGSADISNPSVHSTAVTNLGLGQNVFVWTVDNGVCANGITADTVSVFVNDIGVAAANAGNDLQLCGAPFELQLQGSVTIGNTATGTWSVIEGHADFENANNEATYISNLALGDNTFLWTVDNGICGISSDEVTITVFDPEHPDAFAGTALEVCEDDFIIFNLPGSEVTYPATGTWTIVSGPIELNDLSDPNSTVWSLGSISSPLVPVTSEIIWTVDNGPCGSSADTAVFTLLDCLTLEIPDAFSPNGDGINDFFEVPNLYKYPNNSIKIFNRWGVEVFQAAPYKNDWDGRSRHPATIGEELPSSTYYYILDIGEPTVQPFNGFIYLKR